ncbi:MAG: cupin domain-containing protein [Bryobacteraceae bacterium]
MDAPLQTPPPYLRQRILDQIAAISAPSSDATPPEATLVRAHDSPWASTPAPGVSARPLLGDRTVLIRMQPGAAYPSHEHSQAEQCYVIEGTLTDSDGFTVYAGDFVCMPAGSTHKPIHSDSGCLLLVAYTA